MPYALKNLRWLARHVKLPIALPALMDALHGYAGIGETQASWHLPQNSLTVRIFSFSFHREMPADESGNGGGFVFDARSLPNPGREERFRALTGKDAAVIEYLNHQESVHQYLASAMSLVDTSVAAYQTPRFQEPDGLVRLHRRPAPLCLSWPSSWRSICAAGAGVEVVVRHIELEKMGEVEKLDR